MAPGDDRSTDGPAATPFEQSLRAALEPRGGQYAARLAHLLAELVEGQLSVERFREQVLTDPHLAALLKALVGQEAQAANTTVAFGQGSQVGDVTIRDVIGGHQFQLNIYHDAPPNVARPPADAPRPQERRSPRLGTRAAARSRLTRGSPTMPQPARRLRTFLCHAKVDKVAVRALARQLREAQIDPWLDEEELLPGQDWRREIPRAVEAADVVLVCLSHTALGGTGYLQDEISFALDIADRQPPDSIFLIPLRLVDCPVPERLARWQWVSLYEPDGFARLLRALRVRAAELGVASPEGRLREPAVTRPPDGAAPAQARKEVTDEPPRQVGAPYARQLGQDPPAETEGVDQGRGGSAAPRREPTRAADPPRRPLSAIGRASAAALDLEQTLLDLALLLDHYAGSGSAARVAARLAENAALLPATRLRAGVLTGWLGDPRFPLGADEWGRELHRRPLSSGSHPWSADGPPPYWCYLPAGSYPVGGWAPDQAVSQIELAPFWIARFAITVAQYEPFVAVGYSANAQRWWEPGSWRWKRSGAGVTQPRWWDEALYRGANQPVVGVSWHEATAFCRWLNEQLAAALPPGYQLRLPTEAEWEVAAAWDGSSERRPYPWGTAEPTPSLAIYSRGEAGRPAPVGCCPAGAAACGALDLAGNVWELTTSSSEGYPAQSQAVVAALRGRPLPWRGGSWRADETQLTCGQRFAARPDRGFDMGGFRIVLAPRQPPPDEP